MLKKRNIFIIIGLIVVVGIGSYVISEILVSNKNPPQRYSGIILGNEEDKILSRVCFNCHSNETNWPWYSSLPIINVLISSDVGEAREHLNFSNWESIPEDKRIFYLKMVFNEIEHDEMPPLIYQLGHPEAKINQDDLEILKNKASSLGISFNPNIKSD